MRNAPKSKLVKSAIVGACVLAAAGLLWEVADWSRHLARTTIQERSQHTLNLVVENLRGELSKYRYLPGLLAGTADHLGILDGTASPAEVDAFNRELERVNNLAGALDIYVMDPTGLTVAASNYASDRTFLGRRFDYRPYFRQALTGQLGRYFALGTTSGERGYYFAFPIRDRTDVVGVQVVKVKVDHLEGAWRAGNSEILVVDDDGIVFLSSNPAWHFRSLEPLLEETMERVIASRRYGETEIRPLQVVTHDSTVQDGALISIAGETDSKQPTVYLAQRQRMADAGWTVVILADTAEVNARVTAAVAIAGFMLVSIMLAALTMYQRHRRIRDRIELQQQLNSELEDRVRVRTDELTQANEMLKGEVAERHKAEDELRRTQDDMVQVTKLAALGQLSAGLSHELNQPLAAIRSYADNARAFLTRGSEGKAQENLSSISDLTERMARIIRHLRTFARKEPLDIRPTSVGDAVAAALTLLEARASELGVSVETSLPHEDLLIRGGDARLQQIFVNLFANALDAMETAADKRLQIAVRKDGANVEVTVRDTGTGIPAQDLGSVFDPFFTSKEVGKGLGLGLSITFGIVRQFGGSIRADNHPDGGAVVTLRLVPASVEEGRAA